MIIFSGLIFSGLIAPFVPIIFIGDAEFSGATGEVRIERGVTQTLLQYDGNGDQVADNTITFDGSLDMGCGSL
ncbi:MAG: hypothetical protein AAGH42_05690 [Pseudomonadota bacterium]